MKKIILLLLIVSLLGLQQIAGACVGKTLYVGVVNSPGDLLFAEMISVLVNERTGTTVKVVPFKESRELYSAVKKGEVGVIVETPERGLKAVEKGGEGSGKVAYEAAKKEFRKSLNLIWLEPFGVSQYAAPVISQETIGNLPALPKLLNKLSGVVNDDSFAKLLKSEKGKKAAKDFLKSRKLI
ncbi:hypothetical protein LPW11_20895 [Geomonas sp. RF6]|uniref:glycine betaine ABC transporter substrate-binding protein n=1 Tax=Geomonas sp. RF6 TaxID=2897342 RepID=UPI001E58FFA2|nr:glycine betaine ABC transporter substrate-binding protein [Geomonas sp. RF6]UFS70319.1 hypothetical protein LPW11_20895 [Geomonas sp. RF6]